MTTTIAGTTLTHRQPRERPTHDLAAHMQVYSLVEVGVGHAGGEGGGIVGRGKFIGASCQGCVGGGDSWRQGVPGGRGGGVPSYMQPAWMESKTCARLAMLDPKAGTGISEGWDAVSQLSVRLGPYEPGPGSSPADAAASPGLTACPPGPIPIPTMMGYNVCSTIGFVLFHPGVSVRS